MKKRIVSVILAVCVLGTALAGCGNSTTADNKEGSKDSTEINTQADSAGAQSDSSSDGETASGAVTDVNEDGTVNNPENVKIDDGKLVFWSLFSGGDGTFMDQFAVLSGKLADNGPFLICKISAHDSAVVFCSGSDGWTISLCDV